VSSGSTFVVTSQLAAVSARGKGGGATLAPFMVGPYGEALAPQMGGLSTDSRNSNEGSFAESSLVTIA
jgi:hypothetical protein